MPWGRIDDTFYDHPKLERLGKHRLAAIGLHALALSWCNRWLTDGVIPASRVRWFGGTTGQTSALVEAGMWETAEGGFRIHDFLEYNQSKAAVLADREIARRRSAMNANPALAKTIRERDGDECRYCGRLVNWRNRRGDDGGTYDHIVPIVAGGSDAAENLVVCCRACNIRKGPRTPDQAGMAIRPAPVVKSDKTRLNGSRRDQDTRPDPSESRPNPNPDPTRPDGDSSLGGTSTESPRERDDREVFA